MKRREFMNWVGLGFLASSLPVAIAACQSSDSTSTSDSTTDSAEDAGTTIDKTPREDGFAAVGTVADLDANGSVADKSFSPEAVAVIRDPANADAVVAVGTLCPHQACTVKWDTDEGAFACPCHGSKFNADGSVKNGPAAAPLSTFDAIIDGDLVLVKAKA